MNPDKKNQRTGTEILLDEVIQRTIFMNPPPELRQDIYDGLERIVKDDRKEDGGFLEIVENLTPQQITAYSILEKMGLADLSTGFCYATEKGFAVYESLRRDGVYKDSAERYRSYNIDFD